MASPQIEKGHVKVANELYDKILEYPFTGTELKIVWAVIRYTYGWNRIKAQMTFYQIHKMVKLDRSNVRKSVHKLNKEKILFMQVCRDGSVLIGLNKNYEEWSRTQKQGGKELW